MGMRATLKQWITPGYVFGTTPGVARVFMTCVRCRRVVPTWRLMASTRRPGYRMGCFCGSGEVRPTRISEWVAAYWVLVRGVLIRRLVFRCPDWDPRIPMR